MDEIIIGKELTAGKCSELIKDRFYYATFEDKAPESTDVIHYFTASAEEMEPLNFATIARFLKKINLILSSPELTSKIIVHWTSGSERRRRDVTVCVGVFAIVCLKTNFTEIAEKLSRHSSISTREFLSAVLRATQLGLINFHDFNEHDYDRLHNARLNWIVPRKLLGFYGPLYSNDSHYLSPKQYLKYFRDVRIDTVVRVSHLKYDANPFVNAGFHHYDLNMLGSVPSDRTLTCFLESCEESAGAVVVHCREVLGRTGCLVSAYLIKHCSMTAEEAVAWVRLCTPDCILEAQKKWLKKNEASLTDAGRIFRSQGHGKETHYLQHGSGMYTYNSQDVGVKHSRTMIGFPQDLETQNGMKGEDMKHTENKSNVINEDIVV